MVGAPLVLVVASGQSVEAHGSGTESLRLVLPPLWPSLDAGATLMTHGSRLKPRRPTLTKVEQALLRKLQRGVWRVAEREWLLAHLPADCPTLLLAEVCHRLKVLQIPPTSGA
jgi:hypothetical protein